MDNIGRILNAVEKQAKEEYEVAANKFYTETIRKRKLVINHDHYSENPMARNNLGQFIVLGTSYSPYMSEDLIDVVFDSLQSANNKEHYIELIKSELEDVRIVLPISKREYIGTKYYLSSLNKRGFDPFIDAFYIVFNESEEYGDTTVLSDETLKEIIVGELQAYTKFVNSEVYGFLLHDDNGEIINSGGGYYDIDLIKDSLPEEYANDDMCAYVI